MSRVFQQLKTRFQSHRAAWSAALVCLVLAMLLWGRLLLKNIPRTAVARPDTVAATRPAPAPQPPPAPIRLDWPTTLNRDPFTLPWSTASSSLRENFPSQPAKSASVQADNTERTGPRPRSMAPLRLETTILGPVPRAVIDGRLVAPGDRIQGWTVREIHPRHVTLEKDGQTLRLDMQP